MQDITQKEKILLNGLLLKGSKEEKQLLSTFLSIIYGENMVMLGHLVGLKDLLTDAIEKKRHLKPYETIPVDQAIEMIQDLNDYLWDYQEPTG